MNAAARLVHQNVISRHFLFARLLSRRQITVLILALAVLLSALGIIYTTHMMRELCALYQHYLVEQDNLFAERGQLLLERSTWMTQSRIQQVAESKLNMMIPDQQSVTTIHE